MIKSSSIISINAINGFFNPKNKNDQSVFKTNWMAKNSNAFLAKGWVSILSQTSAPATAIQIYKAVQTGPKSQLGGLKLGFSIVVYQVSILFCVTIPAK